MPKEQIRKRGKRKAKQDASTAAQAPEITTSSADPSDPSLQAGPSGLHPSRAAMLKGKRPQYSAPPSVPVQDGEGIEQPVGAGQEEVNGGWNRVPPVDAEFPFGVLDPDVKAYFRNVEEQIKDWQGVSSVGEERADRKLFLSSVLAELRGHELQVATDPDTAVVLERLLPSMGDWGRRVIGDAFGDEWEKLIRHRFGSHVVQTWFTLGAETLDRESKGIFPPQQLAQAQYPDVGELPSITTMFSSIISSILPSLPSLLTSPHASPPIRLLLLVLTPDRVLPSLDGSEGGIIRSKRSNKFRKGHGVQGKSFIDGEEEEGKGKAKASAAEDAQKMERKVPDELVVLRSTVREELMRRITGGEWRSMGLNMVGCAAVQLLLEIEVEDDGAEKELSLLDQLTEGLVASLLSKSEFTAQPFLTALLSSTTGTRLFEAILRFSPTQVFEAIWSLYFQGKIGKLAGHPYANFVVARGVERLEKEEIEEVVRECKAVSGGKVLIKSARTSVLQALVERATVLGECQMAVMGLIRSALDLAEDKSASLVPCLLALKTYPMYQSILSGAPVEADDDEIPPETIDQDAEQAAAAAARYAAWQNRRNVKPKDELGANMQGCLLLQAMLGLMGGANETVLESLLAQDVDTLLTYSSSPISSHLLDAVFTTPSVPAKYRRRLMLSFQGRYRQLTEDRLGSRVAETMWDRADGFMKEKMARSLLPEATALANSQYGKYLARKMKLHLLQARPEEWKETVLRVKHHFAHQQVKGQAREQISTNRIEDAPQQVVEATPVFALAEGGGREKGNERKRKMAEVEKDEIDDLFQGVEGKSRKRKEKRERA